MDVTFLGANGSLQGVGSGNTSLLVTGNCSSILIDVSGSPLQQLRQAGMHDPASLDAVVLTHAHIDHVYGLPSLLHNLWLLGRSKELQVISNRPTLDLARSLCSVFSLETKQGMFPIRWIDGEDAPHRIYEDLHLQLVRVDHGIPAVGVVVAQGSSKLVYSGDTRALHPSPRMCGARLLVHEAGGVSSQQAILAGKGHSSAADAARFAQESDAQSLLLCHLPLDVAIHGEMLAEARQIFANTNLPVIFHHYSI